MNAFGKRVSDTQMSKSPSGDLEITSNNEEESTSRRATAVQMAQRKIAQPRGRARVTALAAANNRFRSTSGSSSPNMNGATTRQSSFAVQPSFGQNVNNPFAVPGTTASNPFSFSSNPSSGPIFSFGSGNPQNPAPAADSAPATSSISSPTSGAGPIFSFSAGGQQSTANPFVFGSSTPSAPGMASTSTPFQFGASSQPTSTPSISSNPFAFNSSSVDKPITAFQFGATSTPSAVEQQTSSTKTGDQPPQSSLNNNNAPNLFNLNNNNQQSSFQFSSNTAPSSSTATSQTPNNSPFKFSFGQPVAGSSAPMASEEPKTTQSAASSPFKFSFGPSTNSINQSTSSTATADSNAPSAPFKFAFGPTSAATQPPSSFQTGATPTSTTSASLPSAEPSSVPKPTFSFSQAKGSDSSIGGTSAVQKPTFSFGTSTAQTSGLTKSSSSPIFNFGQTDSSATRSTESTSINKLAKEQQQLPAFQLGSQPAKPAPSPVSSRVQTPQSSSISTDSTATTQHRSHSTKISARLQKLWEDINKRYDTPGHVLTQEELAEAMDVSHIPREQSWSDDKYASAIREARLQQLNAAYLRALDKLIKATKFGCTPNFIPPSVTYTKLRAAIQEWGTDLQESFGGSGFGSKDSDTGKGSNAKEDRSSLSQNLGSASSNTAMGAFGQRVFGAGNSSSLPAFGQDSTTSSNAAKQAIAGAQPNLQAPASSTANKIKSFLDTQNSSAALNENKTNAPSSGGFKPVFSASSTSHNTGSSGGFKPTLPASQSNQATNFFASFGAKAEKAQKEERRKRREEAWYKHLDDLDSDPEDEDAAQEEFYKKWDEEENAKKRKPSPNDSGTEESDTGSWQSQVEKKAKTSESMHVGFATWKPKRKDPEDSNDEIGTDESNDNDHNRPSKKVKNVETPNKPMSSFQSTNTPAANPNPPSITINGASTISRTPSPASSVFDEAHDNSISRANIFGFLARNKPAIDEDDGEKDDDEADEAPETTAPKPQKEKPNPSSSSSRSLFDRISREPSSDASQTPRATESFKSTNGVGDQTWKPDSPIKFGQTTASKGPDSTTTTPFKGLFGPSTTAPASTSSANGEKTNAPFTFSQGPSAFNKPSSLIPPQSGAASLFSSSFPSATTSRATTPSHAGSDSHDQASEDQDQESDNDQADLVGRSSLMNDYAIEAEWANVKAWKYESDSKKWASKGTGVVFVLDALKTDKPDISILMRSFPGGRDILNSRILTDVTYDHLDNKDKTKKDKRVKFIAADASDLSTWLFAFPNVDAAADFAEQCETAQRRMKGEEGETEEGEEDDEDGEIEDEEEEEGVE